MWGIGSGILPDVTKVWRNTEFMTSCGTATVSIGDLGFLYGDAVFDTIDLPPYNSVA